jgi:hypothetical protein
MLYEFALDPAAVAGWTSRTQGRFVADAFRIGNGRVPTCLPSKWKRMVWNAFRGDDQHERQRMEALVRYLHDRASGRRATAWDPTTPWFDNSLREHAREAFHAIVTTARREGLAFVLCDDDLDPTNALWQVARSCSVARTAADYATAFRGLVTAARKVLIVEPVFDPQLPRFTATLEAIAGLEPIATGRVTPCLVVRSDIHTPPPEEFERRCKQYLPRYLGAAATLDIFFSEQRVNGERLHNRFIVTDVGSVMLGDSIDEGAPGETNDVALLDEDHHRRRLAAFGNAEHAFHVVRRFRLTGIARD